MTVIATGLRPAGGGQQPVKEEPVKEREPKGAPLFAEESKPKFDMDDDVLDIPSFLRRPLNRCTESRVIPAFPQLRRLRGSGTLYGRCQAI